jgi:hypothetical protein
MLLLLTSVNCSSNKGAIFHNADWIAGVDYDENIHQDKDNEAYDDGGNKNPKDKQEDIYEDEYGQIDEDKFKDLIEDTRQDANPNKHLQEDELEGQQRSQRRQQKMKGQPKYWNKNQICKEAIAKKVYKSKRTSVKTLN